jgi:ABC-type nickel/cobalt efflux system permease component RcnA
MNSIFSLPQNDVKADWLLFLVMVMAIGIGISIVVVWMVVYRPKNKKKRKHKRRHHRQHNPTLAETGGLPPMRDPNQPPPGP